MQTLWAGMYSSPVRGENADGCWSLAPVDDGQMSRVTTPSCDRLAGSSTGAPVLRSMLEAQLVGWYCLAASTSPVARSKV